ncbi:MAG: plastocyanin [Euryarchaeota archaeon]|nr:plastocyanin [Euryarchaeota archaeon]
MRAFLAVSLLLFASGCLQSQPSPPGVVIKDYIFEPGELTVAAGARVTWSNEGPSEHDVEGLGGLFSSGPPGSIGRGQEWSHTFAAPGSHVYYCKLHPWMAGRVVVR